VWTAMMTVVATGLYLLGQRVGEDGLRA
jgi:hypothetical protein